MKKKLGSAILLISCLFFLAGCQASEESSPAEQYRKVTLTGNIDLSYDSSQITTDGLVVTFADGRYQLELWFNPEGGEVIQQRSQVWLTQVECPNYGTANPCQCTLSAAAKEPQEFTVGANLVVGDDHDVVTFSLPQLPTAQTVTYTAECGGAPATTSDYGSFFGQMFHVLNQSDWSTDLTLGQTTEPGYFFEYKNHQEPLVAQLFYDLSLGGREELVSDL